MNAAHSHPVCSSSARDIDGRLCGLTFESTPALVEPTSAPWLIAVDSSDNARRAVAHAAELANHGGGRALHLVHVQHWLAKEAAEVELAQRALEATAAARALLDAERLPWRLHVAMGEAAEQILAVARQIDAAGIVIGSRGLNTMESLLFGSVAYKILHLSPVPVTVVP